MLAAFAFSSLKATEPAARRREAEEWCDRFEANNAKWLKSTIAQWTGDDVEITIPLPKQKAEGETDFATRGRVVHVAPGKGKRQRIVGVLFTGPRFHRVFSSESLG